MENNKDVVKRYVVFASLLRLQMLWPFCILWLLKALVFKLHFTFSDGATGSLNYTYGNFPISLYTVYLKNTRVYDDQHRCKSCMSHLCK